MTLIIKLKTIVVTTYSNGFLLYEWVKVFFLTLPTNEDSLYDGII